MIYEDKIDWADPNKVGDVLTFTQSKFKSAVLDYQIAVENDQNAQNWAEDGDVPQEEDADNAQNWAAEQKEKERSDYP